MSRPIEVNRFFHPDREKQMEALAALLNGCEEASEAADCQAQSTADEATLFDTAFDASLSPSAETGTVQQREVKKQDGVRKRGKSKTELPKTKLPKMDVSDGMGFYSFMRPQNTAFYLGESQW